ncbi:MAG: uncharacterized protein QOI31_2711 [Solirubrobacterales bacterium]|nr:uncharacterized protein [Solirubrobacterales bacterium]
MVPGFRKLAAIATVSITVALCAGASASEVPAGATFEAAWVESADGTMLQTDIFRPATAGPDDRTPVIVITGPYFGVGSTVTDPNRPKILENYVDLFRVAFAHGYSIVQVSLRGYGASEGCPDLGGPGEAADSRAAVTWAASQPWSTGKVGTYGLSYDGYTQVMNLRDPPKALRAAVMIGPASDQHRDIYMNQVRYVRGALVPAYYASLNLAGPIFAQPAPAAHIIPGLSSTNPLCLVEALDTQLESANRDGSTPFWAARNHVPPKGTKLPVMLAQGFPDESVHADQFLPIWRRLRGPRRAWFAQIPHVSPGASEETTPGSIGRTGFTEEVMAWFDRFLKGKRHATRGLPRVVAQEGSAGKWRAERRWPPRSRRWTLPIVPGPYLDTAGNKGEPGCFRLETGCPPGPSGVGTWTISEPLAHRAHMAGLPRVRVRLSASAQTVHVVTLLYDIDPQNQASLISRGARRVTSAGPQRITLYPQDWRLRKGHRVGLLLSGADDGWLEPGPSGTPVNVLGGRLQVPLMPCRRGAPIEGGPSDLVEQRIKFPVVADLPSRTSPSRRAPAYLKRHC